jgi:hypothetical protein
VFNCPHCQKEVPNAIPKERFDEVNNANKQLKTELGTAKASAAGAEALAAKVQNLEGQLAAKDAQHARDLAFGSLGDESVREVFGLHFDRQAQAEGGEKDPKAWLAKLQADPSKLPPVLAALMPGKGSGGGGQGADKGAGGTGAKGASPLVDTGKGAKGVTPGGAPAFTAEQVAGMSLGEFQQNYAAIVASNPELGQMFPPQLPWGGGQGGSGKGA